MAPCTICGLTTDGFDDNGWCADCTAANFPPPPEVLPQPWWEALRGPLAARQDGLRALRREETPDGERA